MAPFLAAHLLRAVLAALHLPQGALGFLALQLLSSHRRDKDEERGSRPLEGKRDRAAWGDWQQVSYLFWPLLLVGGSRGLDGPLLAAGLDAAAKESPY